MNSRGKDGRMQKAAASAESAWALRAQRVTSRVDEVRRLKDQAGKSSRGRQSGLNTPRCRACTLQYDSQIHLSSEQPHPTFSGGPRSLSALEFSVCFISTWPCSRSPPLYKRVCDCGWTCLGMCPSKYIATCELCSRGKRGLPRPRPLCWLCH